MFTYTITWFYWYLVTANAYDLSIGPNITAILANQYNLADKPVTKFYTKLMKEHRCQVKARHHEKLANEKKISSAQRKHSTDKSVMSVTFHVIIVVSLTFCCNYFWFVFLLFFYLCIVS